MENDNEYFCENCDAKFNDQPNFTPADGPWVCRECGTNHYYNYKRGEYRLVNKNPRKSRGYDYEEDAEDIFCQDYSQFINNDSYCNKCPNCTADLEDQYDFYGEYKEYTCKVCGAELCRNTYSEHFKIKDKKQLMNEYTYIPTHQQNNNTNQNFGYTDARNENNKRWLMFFVCLLFGNLGIHKFIEGKIGMGLLYFFTFGLFYIGSVIDLVIYLKKALNE